MVLLFYTDNYIRFTERKKKHGRGSLILQGVKFYKKQLMMFIKLILL